MKLFICLSISILASIGLLAQPADTLKAYEYLEAGNAYYKELQEYDSAYILYKKAANEYLRLGLDERYAFALLRCGFSAYRGRKYELAETEYKQSLEIYQSLFPADDFKTAAPSMSLGSLYTITGNYYLALQYTTRSLALKKKHLGEDHIDTGVNYYNAGTAFMNYGEYGSAMDAFQNALRIYLDHYGERHQRLSSLYVNMGILYDKRGEPDKALEYYAKSTAIDKELYGEEFYLLAYNYYNMAISYVNLENQELAADYYQKTIDLSEQYQLEELHANAHYGLGRIAVKNGEYDEAFELYQQAIQLFIKYFGEDFPGLNHTYRALAELYADQKAFQRAHEYLQRTLDLLARNFDQRHPFIASTYKQLAELYRKQELLVEALAAIESGYSALLKDGSIEKSAKTDDYLDNHILLDLVREQGKILTAKYQQSGQLVDLELAINTLDRASDFIDQIRRGFMLDQSKLLLQKEALDTYEQAIEISYQLYQFTDSPKYPAMALKFMEKSKATLLAESLQGNVLQHIRGVPDSLLLQEKELKRMISFTENQIDDTENTPDSIDNQLFELRRTYDALGAHIEEEYPEYYNLKYQVEVKPMEQTQDELEGNEAVLSYFMGKKAWYVLAFTHEDQSLYKIDSASTKNLRIEEFRDMINDPSSDVDQIACYELYEQLVGKPIAEFSSAVQRLTIVPVGILGHIPFEALAVSKEKDENGRIPYLITMFSTSYTPSITLLKLAGNNSDPKKDYLGFAPVEYDSGYSVLTGSYDEISQANLLFDGNVFLREQASEYNFKNIEPSLILHLATHAQVDDTQPMRSRLMFSSKIDSIEDGNLYASEIYNLNLNSKLTILSACNTGYGKIVRGEGIMNLSRAFQYAGTPTIVMSLWKATDASTSMIMNSFLQNLKRGIAKDESLRQAKLDYLSDADPLKAHPAHWAAFVLVGDPTPLSFKDNAWKWLILGSLFIAVLAWFIIRPTHKARSV